MTPAQRQQLLARFNGNAPAHAGAIRKVETESGVRLPIEYSEFLQHANGGEGFVGPRAYLILWRVEELHDLNTAYQVSDYAPGLFLIGSDGGGEAYAFDTRSDSKPIVSVPFVGMELKLTRAIASGFEAFLEALFKS